MADRTRAAGLPSEHESTAASPRARAPLRRRNPRFTGCRGPPVARRLAAMVLLLVLVQAVATATIVVPVQVRPPHEPARDQAVIAHVLTVGNSVTVQFN
jgi:hypothetical protein